MNTNSIAAHYDEDYFVNFQKEIGEFGGKANLFLFEKHVQRSDTVVDFGCGGGFLLKNLNCREKIGIDLNEVAREYCQKAHGIKCYESLDYLEDGSIDLVISSHCLEHTTNPFEIVSLLFRKLKNKGRIVIVNSFSPMNLGNILQDVGFKDISTMPVLHKWPPGFEKINKFFGFKIFHFLSWIYGSINKRVVQVKGIGTKRL